MTVLLTTPEPNKSHPGMHELALARGDTALVQGFPTCTLALFAVEGEWPDLAAERLALLDVLRA